MAKKKVTLKARDLFTEYAQAAGDVNTRIVDIQVRIDKLKVEIENLQDELDDLEALKEDYQ